MSSATRLFKTTDGVLVAAADRTVHAPHVDWDDLFDAASIRSRLDALLAEGTPTSVADHTVLAPIGSQEVWAAGVTYLRSRTARMEESADAGGSDFYDRVYEAHRPELFFKATAHRVVGTGATLPLRSDAKWNVPEPEMTLALDAAGGLVGYTIGNDLSSRDIEGENPLYLPQAKIWRQCAALGPCLVVTAEEPSTATAIHMSIQRGDQEVFVGETSLAQMKQTLGNLREHLFRDNAFPHGTFLMTGAGIVPGDDFTLASGDVVRITIDAVGCLENTIA